MSEGTAEEVLSGSAAWSLHHGDCLEMLRGLPDCCVDSVITDPPYGLGKEPNPVELLTAWMSDVEYKPGRSGFMGKAWDAFVPGPHVWREVIRVLKPGGHAFVFAGTRTADLMGLSLRLAGFEIRDGIDCEYPRLSWLYGSGFPKSLDLAKAADRALGIWRGKAGAELSSNPAMGGPNFERIDKGDPVTAAAALQGLGSALKPANEPILVCRKPLAGTLLSNVQTWGTGALDIDACRVAHAGADDLAAHQAQVDAIKERGGQMGQSWKNSSDLSGASDVNLGGRWPPNVLLVHHPECKKLGAIAIKANPTWDTPNRNTEPSAFTGSEVSKVRHANGRDGEASADKRYAGRGSTTFAALPGARRDDTETVEQWVCVEGCPVRELDSQAKAGGKHSAGHARSGSSTPRETAERDWQGPSSTSTGTMHRFGDGTGASRFFPQFQHDPELDDITPFLYLAKAARAERDAGLDNFRLRTGAEATDSEEGQIRLESPRSGAGRGGGVRNIHPTIKPIELIRWLAKLSKARGTKKPIALIPYGGAGSEMIACLLEGHAVIAAELNNSDDEPFVSIARARIAHHVDGRTMVPRESLRSSEPPKQASLFSFSEGAGK